MIGMQPPSFSKSILLATAVGCTLGALFLKSTEPASCPQPSPRVTSQPARPATNRSASEVVAAHVPRHHHDRGRAPSLAAATIEEGVWLDEARPEPAIAHDEAWLAAPIGGGHGLGRLPALPVVATDGGIGQPGTPRPPHPRHRRAGKHRRTVARTNSPDTRNTPRNSQLPGGPAPVPPQVTPPALAPAAPTTVASSDPAAPAPADVAFHSPDDVAFATEGQVAIPLPAQDPHDGGTVSLWVQPGWEKGNKDDATLVQLSDRLRLAKNDRFLSLETATDADADGVGPASV